SDGRTVTADACDGPAFVTPIVNTDGTPAMIVVGDKDADTSTRGVTVTSVTAVDVSPAASVAVNTTLVSPARKPSAGASFVNWTSLHEVASGGGIDTGVRSPVASATMCGVTLEIEGGVAATVTMVVATLKKPSGVVTVSVSTCVPVLRATCV